MNYSLAVFSSIFLSIFLSFETIIIRYINLHEDTKIPAEQLVFLVELAKTLISINFVRKEISSTEHQPLLPRCQENSGLWIYLIPATVYTVSNNLTYYVLREMGSATYNLLLNLKISMTVILAYTFLRKDYKISTRMLLSFLLLFLGAVIGSTKFTLVDGGKRKLELDTTILGVFLMILYTLFFIFGGTF